MITLAQHVFGEDERFWDLLLHFLPTTEALACGHGVHDPLPSYQGNVCNVEVFLEVVEIHNGANIVGLDHRLSGTM